MSSRTSKSGMAAAAMVAVCVFLQVDCGDHGVSPVPGGQLDYRVYFHRGAMPGHSVIPIYSTKNLVQTDSILFDGLDPTAFVFSPDGKYRVSKRAVDHGPEIVVEEMATGDTLARMPDLFVSGRMLLSFDSRYLISQSEIYQSSYYWGAAIYSLPDLQLQWIDSAAVTSMAFLDQTGKAVFGLDQKDSLFVIDYLSRPPTVISVPGWPGAPPDSHYTPYSLAVDPVSKVIYAGWNYGRTSETIRIYKADDFNLFDSVLPAPYEASRIPFTIASASHCAYVVAKSPGGNTESIYKYDIVHRTFSEFIPAATFLPSNWSVRDLQVTPDGKVLCAVISTGLPNPGSLRMINTDTRKVVVTFDRSQSGQARFCQIYPVAR